MLASLREFVRGGINALGSEALKTNLTEQPTRLTLNETPLNLRLLSGIKDLNIASLSEQSSKSSTSSIIISLALESSDIKYITPRLVFQYH